VRCSDGLRADHSQAAGRDAQSRRANRIDDLLKQVPDQFRLTELLKIPEPMDEHTLRSASVCTGRAKSIDRSAGVFSGAGTYTISFPLSSITWQ